MSVSDEDLAMYAQWSADSGIAAYDDIGSMARELIELRAKAEWRDIATAPTDMSDVLVWDGREIWIACKNGFGDWCSKSSYAVDCSDEGFYLKSAAEAHLTHWMPLPPVPTESGVMG